MGASTDNPVARLRRAVRLLTLLALYVDRSLRRRNFRGRGGLIAFVRAPRKYGAIPGDRIAPLLFACNFIGVACARSLHFQFVGWYGNTVPLFLCVVLVVAVEACWNPWGLNESSSVESSLLLTAARLILVAALLADSKRKVR